jgi:hypothetical protein
MSENNNLNDMNNLGKVDETDNHLNNEFSLKILQLEEIIKEKENIIYTMHTKIKQFSMNIEQLKMENEKLKNQILFIEEQINRNKSLYDNNFLIIQPTQRFIVYRNTNNSFGQSFMNNTNSNMNSKNSSLGNQYINSNPTRLSNFNELNLNLNTSFFNKDNSNYNIDNKMIDENFKSKIVPFQMKPFQIFDHSKLDISNTIINKDNINIDFNDNNFLDDDFIIDNNNHKNFYTDINNKIFNNISNITKDINKFNLNSELIQINNKQNIYDKEKEYKDTKEHLTTNESVKQSKNKAGIKLHSSMFFQNCKKIISKNEYKKLLEIVKLSNLKKISKEDTYLSITSLLEEKYPELSNEFKLLFV